MMLLKLTLASIAFAAVAAQSDSAITAEIERLQLIMVSANNKRMDGTQAKPGA